ncbi:putative phage abortive infection protein [Pseudomonas yamanorum]|uniref:Phage abortive infection protein n=1 Tax=Pseudomonas yamanorum TaxID=515393 RepID=A0A7Y8EDZ7_9PSED|nr:putative phage abortive infection protein [Pseudomonas yamanorum]NWE12836.1 hypothetical protein [Pseudomonas yamanorum]
MGKTKKEDSSGLSITLVIAVIVLIYGVYYCFLYYGFSQLVDGGDTLVGIRSGSFGDAFGTLNALFSGLAFSGVLITVLLQRKDLRGSQEEASRQQIESQFYNMLRLQQEIVSSIDLQRTQFNPISNSSIQIVTQGRDCFKSWDRMLKVEYEKHGGLSQFERVEAAYGGVWEKHRNDLGLYLRSLLNLFRFLSKSNHVDKKWLGDVVLSMISDYELVIIFYSFFASEAQGLSSYAEEFSIFENIDVGLLLESSDVLFLDKKFFGNNLGVLRAFPS